MKPTSRLETPVSNPRTTMKLQALIADLRWQVHLLESDIQDEQKRTGIFDVTSVAYPTLARNLRARRDNLLVTIALLEGQLPGAEIAA
ncbi:hypothetical protein [Bradyrhizobium sp.]|uniref:hypothetical protein n=1 Tax=Bradyrhizobium sp. TaxID=376 RepID=UPI001E0199F0|nr:hypothetical protein [Bradyrhizobium sp.]MBV8700925.1 hypothetical protein [Bradyrhizobium sp.]MBV8918481.1 hypothetical protein [Bradyrhizobium sp.]MBV9982730.1 hypothetical protein [Bradyrhizobium sp.]